MLALIKQLLLRDYEPFTTPDASLRRMGDCCGNGDLRSANAPSTDS